MPEIYGLFCPQTKELRYIGKANNSQARFRGHLRDARRRGTPLYCWMRKLSDAGLRPEVRVLEVAEDWRECERRLIREYRGGGARLLNLAEGGDEPHCPTHTRAANGRASARNRNRTVHRLVCFFGREAQEWERAGKTALAKAMRQAQGRLQSMSRAEQDRFADIWVGRHGEPA